MGLSNNLGKLSSIITSTGSAVGIAQSSPSYTLDVSGTGRFTGNLISSTNILIGTTTVGDKLTIVNSGSFAAMQIGNGTNSSFFGYANASGNYNNGASSGDAIIRGFSGVSISGTNGASTNLYINSTGNVGIGTSSPSGAAGLALAINGGASQTRIALKNNTTGDAAGDGFQILLNTDGEATIEQRENLALTFGTNATERMRITSAGQVLMHSTSYNSANIGQLFGNEGQVYLTVNGGTTLFLNRLTSDGLLLEFQKNTVTTGSISTNTYSLPSDLNFKKNINNLELGLNLITKLRAVSYNHKIDDDDAALGTGFIAQELEQSLTELGVKENEYYILQHKPNEDKKQSQYWLDYTKMIPVLVNAIQELSAQNQDLKSRLDKAGL